MTGLLPQLDFKKYPVGEVSKIINDDIIIVVMLETPKAINNVEEIASVPGIDVLLVEQMIFVWKWESLVSLITMT